jgi:beta-galactosidase/beta-glucuronidase
MCGTMDPDVTALRYGIRTVATSPREGLLINGTPVLLRGACIHHDNGVLGAREYREAAARRIRILKENGYNAIRSSHNPASSAILDECDRQGMYVINEFTDMWTRHKLAGDYASDFVHNWKHDLKDMVMHSCNHPSIVAWSVGNGRCRRSPIEHTGSKNKGAIGRRCSRTQPLDERNGKTRPYRHKWVSWRSFHPRRLRRS